MRTRIASTALLSTLAPLLLALAAASPVAAQDDCTLTVKPKQGGPGTEFVFSGSGYSPTRIVLRQDGGPSKSVSVTPDDLDRFTIRLVAGKGDTGEWRATAIEPDVCRASVSFTVGLPPTSTIEGDGDPRGPALAGFAAALGVLFVAASVVARSRVTRNARSS